MTKILVLCIGLISFSASASADTSYTEIREYVNRTAADYCGKNKK